MTTQPLIRVAVIGAGGAGLCALRHLTARPSHFTAQCYEQSSVIGGTWVYDDSIGEDKTGRPVASSMYKNLITNLPTEVMAFPDFPFDEKSRSFVPHTDVRKYLENYCKHFSLRKFIKLSTRVVNITVNEMDGKSIWSLTSESDQNNCDLLRSETQEFDAVMICNGHYSVPFWPKINGADNFKGKQLHSKDYKIPDLYSGLNVLCIGGGNSGVDISVEISCLAKNVILCHKHPRISTRSPMPSNFQEKYAVTKIKPNSVLFDDGSEHDIDVIIYCTGYKYSYPFLSKDCDVRVDDQYVHNLYRHLIHTKHTSLSFIGMTQRIVPFPQFHVQVLYFLAVLDGSITLPSADQMEDHISWYQGVMGEYGLTNHTIGPLQWDYYNDLCEELGLPVIQQYVTNIYYRVSELRSKAICSYKTHNFRVTGPRSFDEEIL